MTYREEVKRVVVKNLAEWVVVGLGVTFGFLALFLDICLFPTYIIVGLCINKDVSWGCMNWMMFKSSKIKFIEKLIALSETNGGVS